MMVNKSKLLKIIVLVIFLLQSLSLSVAFGKSADQKVGTFFLIGGSIGGNPNVYNAIKEYGSLNGNKKPKIGLIYPKDEIAESEENFYVSYGGDEPDIEYYASFGFEPYLIPVAVDNYQTASVSKANIDIARSMDIIYFDGGWQNRHIRQLLNNDGTDTPLMSAIRSVFLKGGAIGGTSAGAAAFGVFAFGDGDSYNYLKTNNIALTSIENWEVDEVDGGNGLYGLGMVNMAIDTHTDARGRLARVLQAMKQYHKDLGVGIPESTMLAIRGDEAKVHGAAPVIIYDGKNAVYPNDQYTTAYGLTVHAVTHLDSFNLKTRKVVSTKKEVMATKDAAVQSADIFTKSRNEGYNVMRGLIEAKVNKVETTSSQKSPQFTVTFTKLATAKGYSDGKPPTVTDIQLDITHETSTPLNKIVKPAAKQIMKTNATRQLKAKEPILMINNKQIITNTAAIAAGKIYVAISELADYLPITVESIDNGRTIYFIKDGVTKVVARQNYSIIDDYSYNTDRIVYFKNVSYLSVDLITTALGGKLEYSTDNASKRRVAKITY